MMNLNGNNPMIGEWKIEKYTVNVDHTWMSPTLDGARTLIMKFLPNNILQEYVIIQLLDNRIIRTTPLVSKYQYFPEDQRLYIDKSQYDHMGYVINRYVKVYRITMHSADDMSLFMSTENNDKHDRIIQLKRFEEE